MHKNSVPMEKEVNLSCKNGEEITKIISYRLQFTDERRERLPEKEDFYSHLK